MTLQVSTCAAALLLFVLVFCTPQHMQQQSTNHIYQRHHQQQLVSRHVPAPTTAAATSPTIMFADAATPPTPPKKRKRRRVRGQKPGGATRGGKKKGDKHDRAGALYRKGLDALFAPQTSTTSSDAAPNSDAALATAQRLFAQAIAVDSALQSHVDRALQVCVHGSWGVHQATPSSKLTTACACHQRSPRCVTHTRTQVWRHAARQGCCQAARCTHLLATGGATVPSRHSRQREPAAGSVEWPWSGAEVRREVVNQTKTTTTRHTRPELINTTTMNPLQQARSHRESTASATHSSDHG